MLCWRKERSNKSSVQGDVSVLEGLEGWVWIHCEEVEVLKSSISINTLASTRLANPCGVYNWFLWSVEKVTCDSLGVRIIFVDICNQATFRMQVCLLIKPCIWCNLWLQILWHNEPRGFGFVQYVDPADAADAKYHMDGRILLGREITVVFAEENRKKPAEMRAREHRR